MKLVGIRIRNYRTISSEQYIDLTNGVTLVGPNNAGKTNLLTAIRLLFTGYENVYGYEKNFDLTFGQKSTQTSLVGIFVGDKAGKDKEIYDNLAELKQILGLGEGESEEEGEEIQLYLTFSSSSNPSYRFFPNTKRPSENTAKASYSRKERDLTSTILSGFVCHYVPSNKSFDQLYADLLIPFIKRHVASTLESKADEIKDSLSEAANSLTTALSESGLKNYSVKFDIPNSKLTDLISGFEFKLLDPNETSLFKKGVGIQSTSILSSFDWITERERQNNLEVVWLIEEPEAFLHPTLNAVCKRLLLRLQVKSLVVLTTHSLSFVPQDPKLTAGISLDGDKTVIRTFKTYRESTEAIRNSIGVRFSDFFNFGTYNILMEGQTDREYLQWVIAAIPEKNGCEWPKLRSKDCQFLDYGGVRYLAGFLRASWEFIRKETCAVSLFDGDSAGAKERKDLQHYFGNKKIPFSPNEDFVSVRRGYPIEGLFPDSWVTDAYVDQPAWFDDYSVDASGDVESFKIRDLSKTAFLRFMKEKASGEENTDWASQWIAVLSALEKSLDIREKKISGNT